MRKIVIALLLACVSGPAFAQSFPCSGAAISPYAALVPTALDHRRYAPGGQGLTKQYTAFFATFDDADDDDGDGQPDLRLNPEFVSYELRGVAPNANGDYAEPAISIRRPSRWYHSPEFMPLTATIPGLTSTRLDDSYDGIGTVWNRGHLTMSDHAQRISPEASCNTHHFWNASPQAADMNQGPWQHLENYSAAAANKFRSVWVIAGPIFDRSTPRLRIGDTGEPPIEIPDAFFKVIIHEGPSGIQTLAFIFEQPNGLNSDGDPVPTATWVTCSRAPALNHRYDHRPQLVSIAQIESRTRLRFFSTLPNRAALVSAQATHLWPVETRFWDSSSAVCARQRGHA